MNWLRHYVMPRADEMPSLARMIYRSSGTNDIPRYTWMIYRLRRMIYTATPRLFLSPHAAKISSYCTIFIKFN